MKETQYIHKAIIQNGKIKMDNVEMWRAEKANLEGKKVDIVISEQDDEEVSKSQRGLYFGVIIGQYISNHEWFRGKKQLDIHDELMYALRSFPKTILDLRTGKETTVISTERFSEFGKRKMTKYINDVLDFMAIELEMSVQVEEIENFKLNKYEVRRDKAKQED